VLSNPVKSMKKILSERNLVVVLFIAALIIFSFAQEDARKAEKLSREAAAESSFFPAPNQDAQVLPVVQPVETSSEKLR